MDYVLRMDVFHAFEYPEHYRRTFRLGKRMSPTYSFFRSLDPLSLEVVRHQRKEPLLLGLVALFLIPFHWVSSWNRQWIGKVKQWISFETLHHNQEVISRFVHLEEVNHSSRILPQIFYNFRLILKCAYFRLTYSLFTDYLTITSAYLNSSFL